MVWAHNSHIGDASKTEMGVSRGELNIGQAFAPWPWHAPPPIPVNARRDSPLGLVSEPMRRVRLGHAARATSTGHGWPDSCAAVLDVYRELGAISNARARSAA